MDSDERGTRHDNPKDYDTFVRISNPGDWEIPMIFAIKDHKVFINDGHGGKLRETSPETAQAYLSELKHENEAAIRKIDLLSEELEAQVPRR